MQSRSRETIDKQWSVCTRPFTQCARLQYMYTPTVGAHLRSLCMRALPHFGLGILAISAVTTFRTGRFAHFAHVSRMFRVHRIGCFARFAHVSRNFAHVSHMFRACHTRCFARFAHVSRMFRISGLDAAPRRWPRRLDASLCSSPPTPRSVSVKDARRYQISTLQTSTLQKKPRRYLTQTSRLYSPVVAGFREVSHT